ncbi:MAG TPA: penicillin-binding protein 2 [Longimicrobiales bacterium]|nr:penicillin-binding protein 2 [Longimicrobiales bacterium]
MVHNKGRLETPRWAREKRAVWARVLLSVVVVALLYSLVRIQVVQAEEFAVTARENMLRPVTVRAPRGTIYDRHGRVVAENRVAYQVQLMPAPRDSLRKQVDELRPVLGLTDDDIEAAFRRFQSSPNRPMAVLSDATPEQVARLEERRRDFPQVLIHEYPKRYYPAGPAVAHLIGYVAEISQEELQEKRFADYRQGRWIGKAGLERQYERVLGGEPGLRYLEVNARGGIKRWLPENMGVPPIPGEDIHLNIDLDLQRYGAFLLQETATSLGMAKAQGAFVAMDPRDGSVLALYSNPSYDPNDFTGGIPASIWNALREDPAKPLLDRATGAVQPPGSVFKMSVAAMALEADVIEADELMPIACTGGMTYAGRYQRCWTSHGIRMDLPLGLRHSCDVYFYQVGIRLGFDRMFEMGSRLAFNGRTGVDLPSEINSIFPESRDWWERRYGYTPQPSEIMSLSIGQGAVTMSPLKLAQVVTGFARPDGRQVVPRLVQTEREPAFVAEYNIDQDQIAAIRKGMRLVLGAGGTAGLSTLDVWDVGGKTGTAQNSGGDDHAWFVGWAAPPGEEPEIVAAMLVYFGKSGSSTASAPVMNAINFYMNRKYGLPFDRYATPREKSRQGLPFDWRITQRPVEDLPVYGYD